MISIIYHSESGHTKSIADLMVEAIESQYDIAVKSMSIEAIDDAFLEKSQTIIFGAPTYSGTFSWQLKKWFDQSKLYQLEGKLGGVFVTQKYIGGGADVAELSMIGHMLIKGMLVYSSGAALGQPYTHYGCVCIQSGTEEQRTRAEIFSKRIAEKTLMLFGK